MAFGDNATTYPVYGQAFDFTDVIKDSTTGNHITGGLTSLAITISKDGGTSASAAGTVTEIATTTGRVAVSLTAADMTANVIAYEITAANSNAVYATGEIKTVKLSEFTGRADAQSPKRLEQYLTDVWGFDMNKHTLDRSTGVYTVLKADSSTTKTSSTLSDTGGQGTATKGKQS